MELPRVAAVTFPLTRHAIPLPTHATPSIAAFARIAVRELYYQDGEEVAQRGQSDAFFSERIFETCVHSIFQSAVLPMLVPTTLRDINQHKSILRYRPPTRPPKKLYTIIFDVLSSLVPSLSVLYYATSRNLYNSFSCLQSLALHRTQRIY